MNMLSTKEKVMIKENNTGKERTAAGAGVHDNERPLALVVQPPQRDLPLVPRLLQIDVLCCHGCLLLLLRLLRCLHLLLRQEWGV